MNTTLHLDQTEAQRVLSYIQPHDVLIQQADLWDNSIKASVKFAAPTHTIKTVKFVTATMLCQAVSQVKSLLVWYAIKSSSHEAGQDMESLRIEMEQHRIVITRLSFKFSTPIPATDYPLEMKITRFRSTRRITYYYTRFAVAKHASGQLVVAVPSKSFPRTLEVPA